MPRPRTTPHPSLGRAVEGLVLAIGGLVSTVAATVHSARDVGHAATDVKVAVKGKGNRKPRSAASRAAQSAKMRAYWAKRRKAKGETRSARKSGPKRVVKAKAATRKPGGAWASMTPEQRAERIAKMRAGRGLRPQDDSRG